LPLSRLTSAVSSARLQFAKAGRIEPRAMLPSPTTATPIFAAFTLTLAVRAAQTLVPNRLVIQSTELFDMR
jgi:hypothetical protein